MVVNIYGDSIMKGTILTEAMRYRATINDYLSRLQQRFGVQAQSRARFGMTIEKGSETIHKDIETGLGCDVALVEFGGNDCDHNWAEVAQNPEGEHLPNTPMHLFKSLYRDALDWIRKAGARPLLMTLPPIDAERYLDFLCRDGKSKENILRWLGDVQLIYRTQERYSDAVAQLAYGTGTPLVDVRSYFLESHKLKELIGHDGIHPTAKGYELILKAFEDYITHNA